MVRLASKCCHMLKQTFTASQSVFFFLNLLNTRCCTTEDRWAQTNQTLVHRQMLEVDHLWPVSNQPKKKTAVQLATDRKVDLCTETWSLMISSLWSNQSNVSPTVIGDALDTFTLQRLLWWQWCDCPSEMVVQIQDSYPVLSCQHTKNGDHPKVCQQNVSNNMDGYVWCLVSADSMPNMIGVHKSSKRSRC